MIKPCLRIALLGFSQAQELAALLHARRVVWPWEPAPTADADALWICGESARAAGEDLLRVNAGVPEGEVLLDLHALDRPLHLTLPLRDAQLRGAPAFDPRYPAQVAQVLGELEAALHPRILQLALGHEIAPRLPELMHPAYRLVRRGELLAALELGGPVLIDPRRNPAELARARWEAADASLAGVPDHFLRTSFAETMWLYVARVDTDLLPVRYRQETIHFRAVPRISPRLMKDAHYAVLSELAAEPQTFAQLQLNVGLRTRVLAGTLSALYYAGAITTNPQRAVPAEAGETLFPQPDAGLAISRFAVDRENRPTVPSPLEPGKD